MDQDTTTTEAAAGTPVMAAATQKTVAYQLGKGAIYGMIIFGIILFGAIAVALSNQKTVEIAMQPEPALKTVASANTATADTATAALSVQGTSDTVSDIEADLNATDLSSLNDINKI